MIREFSGSNPADIKQFRGHTEKNITWINLHCTLLKTKHFIFQTSPKFIQLGLHSYFKPFLNSEIVFNY